MDALSDSFASLHTAARSFFARQNRRIVDSQTPANGIDDVCNIRLFDLPDYVLVIVISWLKEDSIRALAQTCHAGRRICYHQSTWIDRALTIDMGASFRNGVRRIGGVYANSTLRDCRMIREPHGALFINTMIFVFDATHLDKKDDTMLHHNVQYTAMIDDYPYPEWCVDRAILSPQLQDMFCDGYEPPNVVTSVRPLCLRLRIPELWPTKILFHTVHNATRDGGELDIEYEHMLDAAPCEVISVPLWSFMPSWGTPHIAFNIFPLPRSPDKCKCVGCTIGCRYDGERICRYGEHEFVLKNVRESVCDDGCSESVIKKYGFDDANAGITASANAIAAAHAVSTAIAINKLVHDDLFICPPQIARPSIVRLLFTNDEQLRIVNSLSSELVSLTIESSIAHAHDELSQLTKFYHHDKLPAVLILQTPKLKNLCLSNVYDNVFACNITNMHLSSRIQPTADTFILRNCEKGIKEFGRFFGNLPLSFIFKDVWLITDAQASFTSDGLFIVEMLKKFIRWGFSNSEAPYNKYRKTHRYAPLSVHFVVALETPPLATEPVDTFVSEKQPYQSPDELSVQLYERAVNILDREIFDEPSFEASLQLQNDLAYMKRCEIHTRDALWKLLHFDTTTLHNVEKYAKHISPPNPHQSAAIEYIFG